MKSYEQGNYDLNHISKLKEILKKMKKIKKTIGLVMADNNIQHKFKIAICLSGHSKHWNTTAENIKNYFNFKNNTDLGIDIETDYFIHTWDTACLGETVKHNDKDKIIETFNPVNFEQEDFIKENFNRAWEHLFYGHSKCLMLKRNHELDLDFEYNLVIRIKFGVLYDEDNKFSLQKIYPSMTCYTSRIYKTPIEFNSNSFDDNIFWGNSLTMDLVGDQYYSFLEANGKLPTEHIIYPPIPFSERSENVRIVNEDLNISEFLGPASLLYDHMKKIEIRPEQMKISYTVISDANQIK